MRLERIFGGVWLAGALANFLILVVVHSVEGPWEPDAVVRLVVAWPLVDFAAATVPLCITGCGGLAA